MKRMAAALMLIAMTVMTGGGVALAYPPDTTEPATTVAQSSGGVSTGGGTLPQTGSDATMSIVWVAVILLLVGLALFAVAQTRRRQTV